MKKTCSTSAMQSGEHWLKVVGTLPVITSKLGGENCMSAGWVGEQKDSCTNAGTAVQNFELKMMKGQDSRIFICCTCWEWNNKIIFATILQQH